MKIFNFFLLALNGSQRTAVIFLNVSRYNLFSYKNFGNLNIRAIRSFSKK